MKLTDKECRTHDHRQDVSKSNQFHACHALIGLRTSATSQIIENQWLSVERRFRLDCRQLRTNCKNPSKRGGRTIAAWQAREPIAVRALFTVEWDRILKKLDNANRAK
jgi:hypothetical protein